MKQKNLYAGFCAMLVVVAGAVGSVAVAATAPTPLAISQTPSVYSQKGISPNIFFLLDDSGSMQFEYLGSKSPDLDSENYGVGLPYGYPLGTSQPYCSGGSNSNCGSYAQTIPGFAANNSYAAQYRTAYINPNYYNPTVTYHPWACAAAYPESSDQSAPSAPITNYPDSACHWDGGVGLWVMANADPAKAYLNPASTNVGFRDLEVWNDSTDYKNSTANNGYAGSGSGYSGDPTWYTGYSCSWYGCGAQATSGNLAFWPATYFNYFGPRPGTVTDFRDTSNYQRVEICPSSPTTNSNGVSSANKCSPPPVLPADPQPYHTYTNSNGDYVYIEKDGTQLVRTPEEELQNFANWYQYYRSHILMADAGIGIAFMQLPTSFRVDFGVISLISKDAGFTGQTGIQSTEDFSYSYRKKFLQKLYTQQIDQNATPNRLALYYVGQWFASHPDSSAPWGSSQAEKNATGENDLACRANYTLLMTDGQWSGSSPGVGNQDDETGNTITDPSGNSYTYKPINPYKDNESNTLADVAMKFWKTDLQPGMSNTVPVNSQDGAFWQHMVTFTVGLGTVPSLVQDYIAGTGQFSVPHPNDSNAEAQQAVFQDLVNGSVSWPSPGNSSANSPTKIDDTWHAAVDGHGTFASAQNPNQLYKALDDALVNIVDRTAAASSLAVNTEKAGQTRTQLQVFQALFHPQNWWGDVLALPVMATPATSTSPSNLSIAQDANWSASCVLTGGACPQMGKTASGQATHTITAESPSSRTILSWNGASGIAFEASTLSPAALTAIGGANVVNYLRGVRSDEQTQGGTLRTRNSVMGDVVDSSPTFVGAPADNYPDTWSNVLYPNKSGLNPENASTATSYSTFVSNNASRENVVYVGADDGMLHGFRTGTKTDTSTNDGKEVLAYVPKATYSNLDSFASPSYTHHYFVNATPGTGDLFYGGSWHTWLVGGEAGGGDSIYALDVTHPSQFSEGNATSIVKGEWSPSNLTCANVSNCGNDLGDTYGTPVITRLNNGHWGFIFGNGFNSSTGVASIFVGVVDDAGNVTFYELKTGAGPADDPEGKNRPDGIAYVTPVDLNGDHTADYVYAGDYFGNVWRFNLTSNDASNWVASYNGGTKPMFTATNANGTAQPITTKLVVAAVPASNGFFRIMVEFGTGAGITKTQQAPDTTAGGVQSIYGVWDWDFAGWDAGHPGDGVQASTPVAYQYAYLNNAPSGTTLTRANLQQQSITTEQATQTVQGGTNENRVITNNQVCWIGTTGTCTNGTFDKYGWYMDLVSPVQGRQGEKVIYNPVLRSGVLIVTTTIPSTASGVTCQSIGNAGWTMALDPGTGGQLTFEPFDPKGNGKYDQITVNGEAVNTSGISLGAVGSPSFVTYDNTTYIVTNTSGGTPTLTRSQLGTGNLGVQLSWQELR